MACIISWLFLVQDMEVHLCNIMNKIGKIAAYFRGSKTVCGTLEIPIRCLRHKRLATLQHTVACDDRIISLDFLFFQILRKNLLRLLNVI